MMLNEEKKWVEFPVNFRNGQTFFVEFLAEPDIGLMFEPVNGPEHNFQVAQLLRLLKRKRPLRLILTDESLLELDDDGKCVGSLQTDDPTVCRQEWLNSLRAIELSLAEELQHQLEQTEAREYR